MTKVKLYIGGLKKVCDDADTPAAIMSAKNLALAYATDAEEQLDKEQTRNDKIMEHCHEYALAITKLVADNKRLRVLLQRYRDEVASGFHPHMICEEVDEVLVEPLAGTVDRAGRLMFDADGNKIPVTDRVSPDE